MTNFFQGPLQGIPLSEQVTNPHIVVGRYSYYAGYYHGHSFDRCARYLLADEPEADKLIIGSFCSIATGVTFVMHGNQGHRRDWVSTFPFFYMNKDGAFGSPPDPFIPAGDTVVGNDVWIGTEAMIMPGVRIGHGAIVGSRAVVTRDVEPYTVVTGNPARPGRKRFSDEEIAMLLEMAWWDWPVEQIRDAMPLLCSSDIEGLYRSWQDR
ncbi:type B chloramphenicol O-acetyltransferase [Microvirga lotononidis]|uniref:Chloramphenicol acetyltransferase n=1 Tax=Microvirga lotononidis TaxID=864069 RepID=I4YZD7_9HYPH|nr:type B chloramphenicol O-acetyltransferase [Microvirga lotononidis]EIM29329.1 acetyltransferase (isoleucine patch superfamily) [Microvirga lotononidis]WQO29154.1 type B chloramphenicol O-acetyltransferase [Microvirga lotononidis]